MKLNARQLEAAEPKDKPYKLSDGGGLFLLVNINGSRYWWLKYRVAGKEKQELDQVNYGRRSGVNLISIKHFGKYPQVK
ncbi:hypothetical protein Z042_06535 [Chania multitudinisentens RB-25]|uniref:Integrase DNA-binding domain-containing protein n=1 Tax=Chania multitudinisentens RB-25 TaxID=1441930 RepID=W0L6F1_9GAMM|nr:hypothetical protein Z042_06535 [Chania multitudinisentens RB-25]